MVSLFELPDVILEFICSFLEERDLCRILLLQKGLLWPINDGHLFLFFSSQIWKARLTAQYSGPALVKQYADFLTGEIPTLSNTWYPWRSICFVRPLLKCHTCGASLSPIFNEPLRFTAPTKRRRADFTLNVAPCCDPQCSFQTNMRSTHRLIACSIARSIRLWPFISCFPESYRSAIDSFIPFYSSTSDGFSFTRLRDRLSRRCLTSSGKEAPLSISPTFLILRCCSNTRIDTVAIFIDGRWPFHEFSTQVRHIVYIKLN